jgi:hypothetical protein
LWVVAAGLPLRRNKQERSQAAGIDTALKQDDTGGWGFGGLDLDI